MQRMHHGWTRPDTAGDTAGTGRGPPGPVAALLLLAMLTLCGAGCSRGPGRPDILLITLDTTRADRLGCYGYTNAVTPNLDGLAQRGALFERAYTPIPFTLPAHASMLTGLYPPEHGIRLNGMNSLHPSIPLVQDRLREAGYATGAFVASFVLGRKFGLDRGFDVYDDSLKGAEKTLLDIHQYRNGKLVTNAALDWLASLDGKKPFFCWVHLYDPHTPYHAHRDRFGDAYVDRPYDAEIRFMDQQVGRLIAFLEEQGLADRTAVLAVGDHGEGLGDPGELEHGMMLYGSTLRVPFLVAAPPGGGVAGRRVSEPVSIRSVAATVLDLAGLPPVGGATAASLVPALQGQTTAVRPLYAETDEPFATYGWSPLRALITERWKFIRTTRPELYDLAADRGETANLADVLAEQTLVNDDRLAEMEADMVPGETVTASLTEQERRTLESLGYIGGGGAPAAGDGKALPDVKDKIHLASRISRASHLMEDGRPDEAIALMQATLEEEPANEVFRLHLGRFLGLAGRHREAEEVYLELLQADPDHAGALNLVGVCRVNDGRPEAAISAYEQALELDPENPAIHSNLGVALLRMGQLDRAREALEGALALDPGHVEARVNLAAVCIRRGDRAGALKHLEAVLAVDPLNETAYALRQEVAASALDP